MSDIEEKRFVEGDLRWLIENPTSSTTAGITGYRKQHGPDDLFSVYVIFSSRDSQTSHWQRAKLFALAPEMEERLPSVGEKFVLTAGMRPVAEIVVVNVGSQAV
jgi:hypothetical protein